MEMNFLVELHTEITHYMALTYLGMIALCILALKIKSSKSHINKLMET